jgi:hypothetical protein
LRRLPVRLNAEGIGILLGQKPCCLPQRLGHGDIVFEPASRRPGGPMLPPLRNELGSPRLVA